VKGHKFVHVIEESIRRRQTSLYLWGDRKREIRPQLVWGGDAPARVTDSFGGNQSGRKKEETLHKGTRGRNVGRMRLLKSAAVWRETKSSTIIENHS